MGGRSGRPGTPSRAAAGGARDRGLHAPAGPEEVKAKPGRDAFLLLALAVALFPGLVFGGRVLFERDLHQWLFGQLDTFRRCLRGGALPVWDPYPGFGQPMAAVPSAQVFYPWTWLSLLLSPGRTYTVYVLSHLLLGALGMRCLARRLGVSPAGSLVGAALWMCSGPVLSFGGLWHHLGSACWMPWVVVAADRALRSPGLETALWWGGAQAAQILAGSFDVCAMTVLLSSAWVVKGLFDVDVQGPAARRALGLLATGL